MATLLDPARSDQDKADVIRLIEASGVDPDSVLLAPVLVRKETFDYLARPVPQHPAGFVLPQDPPRLEVKTVPHPLPELSTGFRE